jgi:hypothetical protein
MQALVSQVIQHSGGLSDFEKGLFSALAGVVVGALMDPIKHYLYGVYKQWQIRRDLYRELGEVLAILHNLLGRLAWGDGSPWADLLTNFVKPVEGWIPGLTGASEEEFGGIKMRVFELYSTSEAIRLSRVPENWTLEWIHETVKSLRDQSLDVENRTMKDLILTSRSLLTTVDELKRIKALDTRLVAKYMKAAESMAKAFQIRRGYDPF